MHIPIGRGSPKWRRSGEKLVGNDTECVLISRRRKLLVAPLLRRHIGWRAHRQPRSSKTARSFQQFGNAKIDNIGIAPVIKHDVAGFDVAMQYTEAVRVIQRLGKLAQQRGDFCQ